MICQGIIYLAAPYVVSEVAQFILFRQFLRFSRRIFLGRGVIYMNFARLLYQCLRFCMADFLCNDVCVQYVLV